MDVNTITLEDIEGQWYIHATNFPMWKSKSKSQQSFTYTLKTKKNGEKYFLDQVRYHQKKSKRTITGYDYQNKTHPNKFTWKGKGILFFAKSKWQFDIMAVDKSWAVISFSKTAFTKQGVDVISREQTISEETMNEITDAIYNHETLRSKAKNLFTVKQSGPKPEFSFDKLNE
jgi:hypothetical protein